MILDKLKENAGWVEAGLSFYLDKHDVDFEEIFDAQRYALLARAKRVRPTLVLEFCRLFGGKDGAALPFACAVEMVHTYSLIHDDLPCMDDDDMRRGRPTCHKVYGEATALLAGDALLTHAFGVIAGNMAVSADSVRAAVHVLSWAAGSSGMIGGQVMDLAGEHQKLPLETLKKLHAHKTGAMIEASAVLGCLAAGLSLEDPRTEAAKRYARGIGLAFQIVDDVLDVTADAALLGKPIGSDAENEKTTFLTYFGVEEALEYARMITKEAKEALAEIPHNEFLMELADYLVSRNH